MLKDKDVMIDFIRNLSSTIYGKEIFFYDKEIDMWYSRLSCGYIKTSEVISWIENEFIDIINYR